MAQSVGELFMTLGFDVDDQKLKSFNQSINSTLDTMLKLAGVSLTTAGFLEVMNGAGEAAVKLNQMTAELNTNAQAVQRWALAAHQLNPSISVEQFEANYRKFSFLIKDTGFLGGPDAGALSQLGAGFLDKDSDPEVIRKRIAAHVPEMQKEGWSLQQITKMLDQVGLGAGSINIQKVSEDQIDTMTRGLVVTQDVIDKNAQLARKTAELGEAFDKLKADFAGGIAGFLLGKESTAKKAVGYIGEGTFWQHVYSWAKNYNTSAAHLNALKEQASDESGENTTGAARGIRNNNPGNLQPGGTEASFNTADEGLSAMARNLERYGKNGWDSIKSIVEHWASKDAKGNSKASEDAYKKFLSDTTGNAATDHLDLNNPAVLSSLMRAMIKFENGNNPYNDNQIIGAAQAATVHQTITQHISSSQSLADAVAGAHDGNRQQYNSALGITDRGGY